MEGKQEEDGGVVAERSKAGVMLPPLLRYYGTPGRALQKGESVE